MSNMNATTPLALNQTTQCHVTPKWFVDDSEYQPLMGTFRLLANGEDAFREIHDAIAAAKKSVNIICWGFQPSMHFIRDGNSPSIGKLLENQALAGVQVRILCWGLDIADMQVNVNGFDESNTPGRWFLGLKDRPPTATDAQYAYDVDWYDRYDENQEPLDNAIKKVRSLYDKKCENLRFIGRGFSPQDRDRVRQTIHADKGLSPKTKAMLSSIPSHHQKMVLIDYEDPRLCVGFVMGHNMLDEYWDTNQHSYRRNPSRPDLGRNGARPRQDFSSRVTGPIVGDLFNNFAHAWEKESGEKLPGADFQNYPLGQLSKHDRVAMAQILRTQPQYKRRDGSPVEDIKACYLQAVNNASQFIYIENQYFRWPPLAEKIKACAAGQNCWGRAPEAHGPVYLFVITNAIDEGIGRGTVNTYRMLDSLGRADTIPEVARDERADDLDAQLAQSKRDTQQAKDEKAGLDSMAQQMPTGAASGDLTRRYDAANAKISAAEARQKSLEREKAKQQDKENASILQEDPPGLKTHICTLVSPDTPGRRGDTTLDANGRAITREERIAEARKNLDAAEKELRPLLKQREGIDGEARQLQGVPNASASVTQRYTALNEKLLPAQARCDAARKELAALEDPSNPIDWVDVYIHAKLMIVDDAFLTVGSANINTRSMEVDSELNISHHRPEITREERLKLWNLHTNGKGAQLAPGEAFEKWRDIIKDNKTARKNKESPIASLTEFYRGSPTRSNLD